jgi:hypothetical protein
MKPLKKMLTVMLLAVCTLPAMAGSTPDIKIVHAGGKSIAVYVEVAAGDATQLIKLRDVNGSILLTDRVKNQSVFAKKYNMVNLPAGQYYVLVEDQQRTLVQPVTVTKDNASVNDKPVTLFAPAVDISTHKIDLTLLHLSQAPVTIEIRDEWGRKNYSETTTEHGSVQRRFNISALTPGNYTITTKVQNRGVERTFRESFTFGETLAGF